MSSWRRRPAMNRDLKYWQKTSQSMDYGVDVGRNQEDWEGVLQSMRRKFRSRCNVTCVLDTTWKIIQFVVYIIVKILGFLCICFVRFVIYFHWRATGQLPAFLVYYGIRGDNIAYLNSMNLEHKQNMIRANNTIRYLQDDISNKEHQLESLKQANAALETEKHDALRRPSEVASAKLRDNNPNKVDLYDQYRPTKLAEMFSELYDNEWTNAYSSVEDAFGEQIAIEILLKIVMEAYGFCEKRVSGPWDVIMEWFIDMRFPGAEQTLKWLKDSRKAKIRDKVQTVGAEYEKKLEQMFQENKLAEFLSVSEMRVYITKTVQLCLLMVTTDPPVALSCPGWSSGQRIQETAVYQSIDQKEENKTEETNKEDKGKSYFGRSKNELEAFNKDLFKEYTTRGPYLDYPVWPALFLYKNGPLMSKGIAQGKKSVTN